MSSSTREPDGSLVTPASPAPNPIVNAVNAANLLPVGTTTSQTKTIQNPSKKNFGLTVNAATASGGNTIQVTINGLEADGTRRVILVGTAIAAVGIIEYKVSPDMVAIANLVAQDLVPAVIEVVITVVGVVAYGVDYQLSQ